MNNFNVQLVENFLSREEADYLYKFVDEILYVDVKKSNKKRSKVTYGDEGVTYTLNFRGNIKHISVLKWHPALIPIKKRVETFIGHSINVCAIQYYPNGKVGINPHRDKEMTRGTKICGLSLGAERVIKFQRGTKEINYSLSHGSLYIMNPPTNDLWAHSIPLDETSDARISLTFRNYK